MLMEARDTPAGWAVIMEMVDLLEDDDEFERLAELHKGMAEYGGQFLTEKEAKKIVDGFENFDGSHGAKWQPSTLFGAIDSLGGRKDEPGKYNSWAMYAVMNMMSSDYGGAMAEFVQGEAYAKLCYKEAVAWFNDKEKRNHVRRHFGLM